MGKELVSGKMIEIVAMTQAHTAQVAELEKVCFSQPWSESMIASELSNPLSHWIVALNEARVVGYMGIQAVLDEADVMNVAVAPQFRRQGIARRLIEQMTDDLLEKGVVSLTLEVRASNTAAISLYEKQGFTQVGCRKNYYFKPKEDAWILRKELRT